MVHSLGPIFYYVILHTLRTVIYLLSHLFKMDRILAQTSEYSGPSEITYKVVRPLGFRPWYRCRARVNSSTTHAERDYASRAPIISEEVRARVVSSEVSDGASCWYRLGVCLHLRVVWPHRYLRSLSSTGKYIQAKAYGVTTFKFPNTPTDFLVLW